MMLKKRALCVIRSMGRFYREFKSICNCTKLNFELLNDSLTSFRFSLFHKSSFIVQYTHFPTVENAVSSKRSPSKQLRFPQKAEFKRSSFKRGQASNEKSPVMYVTYTAFFTLGKRVDAGES